VACPGYAQLQGQTYASGFQSPIAFVQDPTDRSVQFVVEQRGRIRLVRGGTVLGTDFLNLAGTISCCGERGLLGLAFSPDYASSGRFYVNFTNSSGDTVVARFVRSSPTAADPASRFDLQLEGTRRFIEQPFSNHNGGHLAFGPDGYLYIGLGDGGSGSDPDHRAQNPAELLGKMLRIDVNVPDADAFGYRIPPDNPFLGGNAARDEIWAFGLRNPWRYSFDDVTRGGTGAMVIGDVGQNSFEEIDYEPRGRGGRNYGWRNREAAHDHVTSRPLAYGPPTDPVFEYGRSDGVSVTGGFIYRGTRLGPANRGRYFFADYSGRVWSLALTIDGNGEARASDRREHTAELGGAQALGTISSFGVDADGELYIVGHSTGRIVRIGAPLTAPAAPTGLKIVKP
jgi:glucose/arabinose dehydrogenase